MNNGRNMSKPFRNPYNETNSIDFTNIISDID